MSETPLWMPLYVADYRNDTMHLSTQEHGAYLLLLMQAWLRDGILPSEAERLRRITGLSPKEWKASWPTIRDFFQEGPDGFRHKRLDLELDKGRRAIEQKRGAGKASADARKAAREANGRSTGVATEGQRQGNQPQPQPQPQGEEEGSTPENNPLPHGALAFSGRVIRLNRRDFDQWAKAYHGIPDLAAELTALDDWLREADDPKLPKRWFQVVSGALAKKHQAALRNEREANDPMEGFIV